MAEVSPDLSGILSGLLSNPGAISALSGLLGNLTPHTESAPIEPQNEEPHEAGREAPPTSISGNTAKHPERYRLLTALTPYLSPQRRRALDGAVRILEVLELFEKAR